MKAALYHRVSTVDQDTTLARAELEAAAKARGYEVALSIEETGSGAKKNRPGLLRVLAEAKAGTIQAVIVWKLDRWGRGTIDLLENIRTLKDAGCRFVAITQGIDIKPGADPVGNLLLTMLAGVAEFERELIRERVLLGMAKARREGKRLGRPTVPAPEEQASVMSLRSQGLSWREVGAALGQHPSMARRRAVGAGKIRTKGASA